MNPRAKKKARAISHGIGSPKAEKAAENVRVLVRTDAPSPISATAPSGSGWVMIPTIVARNIASSCQAFLETPAGTGTNQRMTPVAMEARRGAMAAPCRGVGGGGETAAPGADADAAALTARLRRAPAPDSGVKFRRGERRRLAPLPAPQDLSRNARFSADLGRREELDGAAAAAAGPRGRDLSDGR